MTMPKQFFNGALAITALVALVGFTPALAADEGYCKEYASTAVNQLKTAERHRRCDRNLRDDPNRWTSN